MVARATVTAEVMVGGALCSRCKEQDAVVDLRSDDVCGSCYTAFVEHKVIKRLEVLLRETRNTANRPQGKQQKYLLALSHGPSSTALLHVLCENVRRQRARGARERFEVEGVFVDVDVHDVNVNVGSPAPPKVQGDNKDSEEEGNDSDDPLTVPFPEIPIHRVPLSSLLGGTAETGIDWASLLAPSKSEDNGSLLLPPTHPENDEQYRRSRLTDLLTTLPSATARADVTRLLIRHALLDAARRLGCDVLVLGYNTTALAELTLTEAAKGRGFGIPWLVSDGVFPLPRRIEEDGGGDNDGNDEYDKRGDAPGDDDGLPIYSPLRDLLRKEIMTYLSLASSPSGSLAASFPHFFSPSSSSSSTLNAAALAAKPPAVVSHRDLSLDEVVLRYFADVETSYPSVVTNVVRTTGKLQKDDGTNSSQQHPRQQQQQMCGLCGTALDPAGDERWKGELGEDYRGAEGEEGVDQNNTEIAQRRKRRLCYGCERSVRG